MVAYFKYEGWGWDSYWLLWHAAVSHHRSTLPVAIINIVNECTPLDWLKRTKTSHLKNLRTIEAALPPTQFNPKAGSGTLP